jgi:hypothetical protein
MSVKHFELHCDRLAGKAHDPVTHRLIADTKIASDLSDSTATADKLHKLRVTHSALGIVVDVEGLTTEPTPAESTAKALDSRVKLR